MIGFVTRRLSSTLAFASSSSSSSAAAAAAMSTVPSHPITPHRPFIRGVIFDMDGTLTVPNLDFDEMYRRCDVSPNDDILEAISAMPPAEAQNARAIIEEMEEEGRRTLQLSPGALEVGEWLRRHEIPVGLVTRNTAKTVDWMVEKLWVTPDGGAGVTPFRPAISRDWEDVPHKPDPASLKLIAKEWGVDCDTGLLMVGDSVANDVVFGMNAGVSTALVDGRRNSDQEGDAGADICVSSLIDLPRQICHVFQIDGPLGTNVPLLKYSTPRPTTPAAIAAVENDMDQLMTLSVDELTAVDDTGNTPLIWATNAGHAAAVKHLLSIPGVDVNARGFLGNTAASRACRNGDVDILRLLTSTTQRVNWDIPNDKMQYPLHFAAFKLKRGAVDFLLECGANTLVFDRKGRTPAEDTSDEGIRAAILAKRLSGAKL